MKVYCVSYEERLPPAGIFSSQKLAEAFKETITGHSPVIEEYEVDRFGDKFCFKVYWDGNVITVQMIDPEEPRLTVLGSGWIWVGHCKTYGEAVDFALKAEKY